MKIEKLIYISACLYEVNDCIENFINTYGENTICFHGERGEIWLETTGKKEEFKKVITSFVDANILTKKEGKTIIKKEVTMIIFF